MGGKRTDSVRDELRVQCIAAQARSRELQAASEEMLTQAELVLGELRRARSANDNSLVVRAESSPASVRND